MAALGMPRRGKVNLGECRQRAVPVRQVDAELADAAVHPRSAVSPKRPFELVELLTWRLGADYTFQIASVGIDRDRTTSDILTKS